MSDHTPAPNLTLLTTLVAIAGYHRKRYCYPAQDTIRARHQQHTSEAMSAATLNRHLRALERAHLIKRQCRHHRDANRGWVFSSTLYTFTRQTYRWLSSLGHLLRGWAQTAHGLERPAPSLNTERQYELRTHNQEGVDLKTGPPPPDKRIALSAIDKMQSKLRTK